MKNSAGKLLDISPRRESKKHVLIKRETAWAEGEPGKMVGRIQRKDLWGVHGWGAGRREHKVFHRKSQRGIVDKNCRALLEKSLRRSK